MSFTFGAQPTQTQAQPTFGGFTFPAATSTAATTGGFGSTFTNPASNVPATGFTFGAPAATTAQSNPFGTSLGFSNPFPTTSTTGFQMAPAQTTAVSGFNFGGFGNTGIAGFGAPASLVPTTTAAPTFVGLGGVDQTPSIVDSQASALKDKVAKESYIPHELVAIIEEYKKFTKEKKTLQEEISRSHNKNILKLQTDIVMLRLQLSVVSNSLQRITMSIIKLKQDSSDELRNVEIIQRTKDTPPSLQYENTAPLMYFQNLIITFETQIQHYRQQIQQLEKHLLSFNQPTAMTFDELKSVMARLHDIFVTLAAQLQTLHQKVQALKKEFLKKDGTSDPSGVFGLLKDVQKELALSRTSCLSLPKPQGPLPFLTTTPSNVVTGIRNMQNQGDPAVGLTPMKSNVTAQWPTPGFLFDSSAQTPFGVSNQKSFQLQKPPSGNKRGKRWTST